MRRLFVDTIYFVALINLNDQWREKALRVKSETFNAKFITTEPVLIEVLNFFSEYGGNLRRQVSLFVRDVLEAADFEVVPYTETTLLEGLYTLRIALRQRLQLDRLYFDKHLPPTKYHGNSHARPSF